MNPPDIRKQLWNSLDLYCVRHDATLVLIVVPLVMLAYAFLEGLRGRYLWTVTLVFCGLMLLPFLIWFLWELFRVYRHTDRYILCKAKLTQPHGSMWSRNAMYFTVVLEHPETGKIIVNTRPIFQTLNWKHPQLEIYLNRTVTIAYNEETEAVVVIG